ncbi:MAG: SDR family NAD(P)-dependent oxidoreductase, partial [Pseudomonadota bacterium]|nr:SDR family NAD(P)-dependent oxidoreductase [Pseudomonadota bacterium]
MSHPFSLEGKTALVTGANTGLGRGIAVALAGAGADLCLVGRTSPADTVDAIASLGRNSLVIGADQVVEVDGGVLGKPGTATAARAQLERLSNRAHRLLTAVAVHD